MNNQSFERLPGMRWTALGSVLCAVLVFVTACATGMSTPSPAAMMSALSDLPLTPPDPDPRIGLAAGSGPLGSGSPACRPKRGLQASQWPAGIAKRKEYPK